MYQTTFKSFTELGEKVSKLLTLKKQLNERIIFILKQEGIPFQEIDIFDGIISVDKAKIPDTFSLSKLLEENREIFKNSCEQLGITIMEKTGN